MLSFLINFFIFQFLFFSQTAHGNSPKINLSLEVQNDSVHFEFDRITQWNYSIKKEDSKKTALLIISLPPLNDESRSKLKTLKSPFIKNIKLDPNGLNGNEILEFELSSKEIDVFDYLTDQPSRLILDIFQTNIVNEKKKKLVLNENSGIEKPKREDKKALPLKRKPSSTELLIINKEDAEANLKNLNSGKKEDEKKGKKLLEFFDGSDTNYSRFSIQDYEIKEEAIIASKENYFLTFPLIKGEQNPLIKLQINKPIYEIIPKETEENKQARLLLTLYEKKRYNVFLKVIEWYFNKFPNSEYDEILKFMWADTHFELWLKERSVRDFDLAILRYKQSLEKYPESALAERTQILMGFATLDRGDFLGTLRLFNSHIERRPLSPNRDISRFAIANAFLKLNRYEEAIQLYRDLEKNAVIDSNKIHAAYLKGDAYCQKKDFAMAIAEYKLALIRYPQSASEYPNAYYNQALALFGIQRYKESLDIYREFIKQFSSHEFSAYALTRIGEILEILGANDSKITGAFAEAYFRFGDNPSTVVAQLRLLSRKMKQMKPKEVENAVQEITELSKKSDLNGVQQFATIMISAGYSERKEFDKAINLLIKFYQENSNTVDTQLVTNKIIKNINNKIVELLQSKKYILVLETFYKYVDNWLKGSSRIDTKFNVARAYEESGVLKEADILYRDTLNKIISIKGTKAEKERSVMEKIPFTEELHLRLAAINFKNKKYSEAYEHITNIKDVEKLNEEEQIERVYLTAQILDKKEDFLGAIRYLSEILKTWKGKPELMAEPYLFLAQLEIKMNQKENALTSLIQIDNLMTDSQKVNPITHSKALELMANLHMDKKNLDSAITEYEKMLSLYEDSQPLETIRYKIGQIHFQRGDLQKASDTWSQLKEKKDPIWYKLAQEQLNGSKWDDEYKKYIKRIPAMSSSSPSASPSSSKK